MGRRRKYATDAERQRAYRERLAAPPLSPAEHVALLGLLHEYRATCIFPPDGLTDMVERLGALTQLEARA